MQPQITHIDTSKPITDKHKLYLQRIVGKFICHVRAIYETMGEGPNTFSTQTFEGTEKSLKAQQHFLDYYVCNPNVVKLYKVIDINSGRYKEFDLA